MRDTCSANAALVFHRSGAVQVTGTVCMAALALAAGCEKAFRAGDKVQFKVTVDRDAYVRLFNIRPDGSAVMIFPNAYHRDNFLRAGKVLTVPSGNMDFEFVVEPPFGPEAVQAVATTSPLASNYVATRGLDAPAEKEDPFKHIHNGTRGLAQIIRDARSRSIAVRPKHQPELPPQWAEDHWTFVTLK